MTANVSTVGTGNTSLTRLGPSGLEAYKHYLDYAGYGEWSVLTTTAVANNPNWVSHEMLVRNPPVAALSDVPPTGGDLPPTGGDLTPAVTPEPQTYLLMGTGLIFPVLLGRRRMKEMGYV